ncbi:MAG TPA: hypothetical protein VG942_06040, partial [Hyphomonadaceae bacterium]|nr:hypothetical protein [Hyphomonadaceae bacterium]
VEGIAQMRPDRAHHPRRGAQHEMLIAWLACELGNSVGNCSCAARICELIKARSALFQPKVDKFDKAIACARPA